MKVPAASLLLLTCLSGASAFAPAPHSSRNALVSLEMANNGRRHVLQHSAALLLGGVLTTASSALAEPRPTYLTEPTEEFKENERKAMEFRRQQLEIKKKFITVLDRLNNTSKTEAELENDLKELRTLVTQTGGLPNGLKKDDVVKQVRAKKSKGFWPTNVEIAYVVVFLCFFVMFDVLTYTFYTVVTRHSLVKLAFSRVPILRKTWRILCKITS